MRPIRRTVAVIAGLLTLAGGIGPGAAQETAAVEARNRAANIAAYPDAARAHFGKVATPATTMAPNPIGFYSKGCLAGGQAMPAEGDAWQVMRPARNRNWGHPDLVDFIERFAVQVPKVSGWSGILVGDMSQPRGGPMLTGHASHQIGLDADIWLTPMPRTRYSIDQKDNVSAVNMVASDWRDADPRVWTAGHERLIKTVAEDPRVERIFVNPALKAAMCRNAGADRLWLDKVRPMWGHNYHFHVRITCPAGAPECQPQDPPTYGDGCGEELTDWLEKQHRAYFGPKPTTPPGKPRPPMGLDALPAACKQVLAVQ